MFVFGQRESSADGRLMMYELYLLGGTTSLNMIFPQLIIVIDLDIPQEHDVTYKVTTLSMCLS